MSDYTLVIGNKNYSSWSLRPWVLMQHAGIPFRELRIPLRTSESAGQIRSHSPSGRVPVLTDGPLTIWDSLAIGEYLAERHPELHLWPQRADARAVARSVSAEMHSGFQALRSGFPMNCRRSLPNVAHAPEALIDVARILALWRDCRARFGAGGPFLFGTFSVADAMYAPVAFRFATYGVKLDAVGDAYRDTLIGLPAMQRWLADAKAETEIVPAFEPHG